MKKKINRKEALKRLSALGLGSLLVPSILTSCSENSFYYDDFDVNFSGNVLIIGAGAAGLVAGHVLNQYGIDFQILEASSVYGGRVKKIEGFADFPIDLGGEWIHTDPSILAKLLNNPSETADIDIINYAPESMYVWSNGKLRKRNFFTNFYAEYKFKNSTWFDYFEDFIVPGIQDNILLNSIVNEIDYSGTRVRVETTDSQIYEADRVILTVPLTILKNNSITFSPPLPEEKISALDKVDMPDGIKIFMEFSEDFYPDLLFDTGLLENLSSSNGEKLFYDAAFGKETNHNIFALFSVGEPATAYTSLVDDLSLIHISYKIYLTNSRIRL